MISNNKRAQRENEKRTSKDGERFIESFNTFVILIIALSARMFLTGT